MHVGLAALVTAADAGYLRYLLRITLPQTWIRKILVLQTDDQPAVCPSFDRVRVYRKNFGSGFDRQPEAGGFDEIGARNYLLGLAREQHLRWVVLADADEFFLPETELELRQADRHGCSVVWFSCHHLCSPSQYLWWPDTVRKIFRFQTWLHDPHPRAVRPAHYRYVPNRRRQRDPTQLNRTMHCHLRHHSSRDAHIASCPCHFHLRHALGPKQPGSDWLDSQQKVAVDLPDWIRQTLRDPFRPDQLSHADFP